MNWYGSVENRIAETMTGRPEPKIGLGGYLSFWSDRQPYYIENIDYYKNGNIKSLKLVEPIYRHKGEAYMGNNNWDIETWEQTKSRIDKGEPLRRETVKKTRGGKWTTDGTKKGTPYLIGKVEKYYDYEY